MKAAIYSRKSKFSAKGESIENQIQMCKEYAGLNLRDKGITEFYEYEDEGYSGGNTNRPKFQELMEDVKNKKFDILICYRLDRISRNVADFSSTLEILQSHNIDFVSIKEQFDTTTPMGRAMIYISSVFAQLERETIAERVRDNMLELAKTGRWLGGVPPLGYNSKSIKFFDENMKERSMTKLTKNVKELDLVKLIFEKYIELGSLASLETYLLQNYYKSKSGANFSKNTLSRILTNSVYVKSSDKVLSYLQDKGMMICGEADGIHGLLTYNKLKQSYSKNGSRSRSLRDTSEWIAAVSNHDGIVSDEDWIKVQKLIESNKNRFILSARTHNALLTSIIKCDKCGSRMRILHGPVSPISGKKFFYYACNLKKESKGVRCDNLNGKANDIDIIVVNAIKEFALNKQSVLENLMKKYKESRKDVNNNINTSNIDNLITQKETQIDNLLNKMSLDPDLSDIIFSKIKTLKEELKQLKNDKANQKNSVQNLDEDEFNISFIEYLLSRCSIIDKLSFDEKKELIRGITEKITWNGETSDLEIIFIGSEGLKKKD
ncbi:recombinase family protein [Clostridium sp. LP20]|uniref:recombinase family protein n=1 Tax=Clostridium sp. LP20 TaxID=3418665 RepID=UPI003EE7535D